VYVSVHVRVGMCMGQTSFVGSAVLPGPTSFCPALGLMPSLCGWRAERDAPALGPIACFLWPICGQCLVTPPLDAHPRSKERDVQ
jgi:hypothetical protein